MSFEVILCKCHYSVIGRTNMALQFVLIFISFFLLIYKQIIVLWKKSEIGKPFPKLINFLFIAMMSIYQYFDHH